MADLEKIIKMNNQIVGTDSPSAPQLFIYPSFSVDRRRTGKSVRTNQSVIKRTGFKSNTIRTGYKPVPTQKFHGIPEIIRQFKTFSARRINKIQNSPGQQVWQRSYYDHIIRKEKSLDNIRLYIRENPPSWETDRNNPENLKN